VALGKSPITVKNAPGFVVNRILVPMINEAFFVLAGEQTIRSPGGVMVIKVGQPAAGNGADVPMQVSSSGAADLHALVMFVVDAAKPFSSPAKFP